LKANLLHPEFMQLTQFSLCEYYAVVVLSLIIMQSIFVARLLRQLLLLSGIASINNFAATNAKEKPFQ